MKKYDRDMVLRRMRARRRARREESGQARAERTLNLFLGVFVLLGALVLAVLIMLVVR